MTFSCTSEKGPPLILEPILLAGTCAQYSKKATPHEKRITRISGQPSEIFISCSFKWPYHAKVIKMLDTTNSRTVQTPCIKRNKTKLSGKHTHYIRIQHKKTYENSAASRFPLYKKPRTCGISSTYINSLFDS